MFDRAFNPARSEESNPSPPNSGRYHRLVPIAERIFPRLVARIFARRYLQSGHHILGDKALRKKAFEVLPCGDGAVLRSRSRTNPDNAPRCLIVPGHDGHFRQFLRMMRGLHQGGFNVDILALPGHLEKKREPCSMRSIAQTVRQACTTYGPYHMLVAHCVSANAVIFELENGSLSDLYAFVSIPLNLTKLIRSGGETIGLSGESLTHFVDQVDAMGAPYHLDTDWLQIAQRQTAPLLMLHSENDFAAPIADIYPLAHAWPDPQIELFESGGHNGIVSSKPAIDQLVQFALENDPVSKRRA